MDPTNFTSEFSAEEFRKVVRLKPDATGDSKEDFVISSSYMVPLAKAFDAVNKVKLKYQSFIFKLNFGKKVFKLAHIYSVIQGMCPRL